MAKAKQVEGFKKLDKEGILGKTIKKVFEFGCGGHAIIFTDNTWTEISGSHEGMTWIGDWDNEDYEIREFMEKLNG